MVMAVKNGKKSPDLCGFQKAEPSGYGQQTVEDIKLNLVGAQVFSKLDAAGGFWQVPLEANSQKYIAFIPPFGRFMFIWMRFGITSVT